MSIREAPEEMNIKTYNIEYAYDINIVDWYVAKDINSLNSFPYSD